MWLLLGGGGGELEKLPARTPDPSGLAEGSPRDAPALLEELPLPGLLPQVRSGAPNTEPFQRGRVHWARDGGEGPPARAGADLVYDPRREVLVLFGGLSESGAFLADTWERSAAGWRACAQGSAPPPRRAHLMAYHGKLKRLVLFGGSSLREGYLGDTWLYDGKGWKQHRGAGPSPRSHFGLTYDGARGQVVLFGGRTRRSRGNRHGYLGDTWVFDERGWREVRARSPSPRRNHALAYDPERQRVVLFGGFALKRDAAGRMSSPHVAETWEWDGSGWTQRKLARKPSPRRVPGAMVYDPRRRAIVLFGGNQERRHLNDVWSYDGSSWTSLPARNPPQGRDWVATAFDGLRQRVVVFGGDVQTSLGEEPTRDAWEF